MKVDREELEKAENELTKEGESPETGIAGAVSDDMAAALTTEAGAEPAASALEALVVEGLAR